VRATPDRLVVIRDPFRAVVVRADDVGGRAVATLPASYGEVTAVAARGDGQTFYAATSDIDTCRATIYRFDTALRIERVAEVAMYVRSLAVAPDTRRLAYAGETPGTKSGVCHGPHEVRVRDLGGGAERVWSTADELAIRTGTLGGLTWSPDGRYLAVSMGAFDVRRIDVTAPIEPIPSLTYDDPRGDPPHGLRCTRYSPAYLPTGELTVVEHCGDFWGEFPATNRVVVYDPAAKQVGRAVLVLPGRWEARWVVFDRSGRHAFLGLIEPAAEQATEEAPRTIRRWDGGALRKLVEGKDATFPLAW
jgi:hypothetical protein